MRTSCFPFLEKYLLPAMYVGWGPPHLSLVVCYLLHLRIPISCKTWYYKECIKKYKNLVLDVIRTLDTSIQTTYHNLQNICLLFTLTIMSPKQMFHTTVMLGPLKLSLRAIIDHHGPPIHSGHSTASIKCCKICNDSNITEFEIIRRKNSLYCICYTLWIDWLMRFGLEQEGGSLITPMALAHPRHPIKSRSRKKRRHLWVGRCFSSWCLIPNQKLCVNIYSSRCMHSSYEFCSRTYIYIYIHARGVSFSI